ncbi:hypothetical protein HG530_014995 [Fusarium avenaceum]|nr:hypothetical protein HG530_014995 [Fusarium avenaceum]
MKRKLSNDHDTDVFYLDSSFGQQLQYCNKRFACRKHIVNNHYRSTSAKRIGIHPECAVASTIGSLVLIELRQFFAMLLFVNTIPEKTTQISSRGCGVFTLGRIADADYKTTMTLRFQYRNPDLGAIVFPSTMLSSDKND